MKSLKNSASLSLFAIGFLMLPSSLSSQGTFQNLDFEQANPIPGSTPFLVAASNAIPGWVSYVGPEIAYNTVGIGGASISLHDSMSTYFQPLQGNYSVLLQGSSAGPPTGAAIGQTGQIPTGSLSVRFWAFPASNLQVTFGGTIIPMFQLATTANYDVIGGDISMFAGQTAELRFTGLANSGGYFDNIFFSTQAVPEPGALGLLSFGLLLLFQRKHMAIKP
jgi:hypothetical protein